MKESMAELLHAKGRAEGALINSREILRDLLEDHFGPLPEELQRRIESATDLERLKACIHQAHALNSLDELPL